MIHRVTATAGRLTIALIAAVAFTAGHAAPAVADDDAVLGSVTVTPTGGSVDGTPMLRSAVTTGACPAGYGANVLLRVGPPGGPYNNIVRPSSAGAYDRQPVTLSADRSMTAALGRAPADGDHRLVVECSGAGIGRHPSRFETRIVVSGDRWRVAPDGGSAIAPGWWLLGAVAVLAGVTTGLRLLRRGARQPRAAARTTRRPVPVGGGAADRPASRRDGGSS